MSNYFADTVATDLRILGRIMQETTGGIQRTGWMNLILIITMASILSIFGTLFLFVMDTQLFVDNIGSGLKLSVYAKNGTEPVDIQRKLKSMPVVKSVDFVPKEKAWQDMKTQYQVPDIQNPLPDTFHVQLIDQNYLEQTYKDIKNWQEIEDVYFARNILKHLQKISRTTSYVGMGVSLFFGMLTLFIISNTIHLLIRARAQEIEILRMMGVGIWYIQLPFFFQGAFYGIFGALIAYIPLSIAQDNLTKLFNYFELSISRHSIDLAFVTLLLMGLVMGAGGAAISVRKYLHI